MLCCIAAALRGLSSKIRRLMSRLKLFLVLKQPTKRPLLLCLSLAAETPEAVRELVDAVEAAQLL